MKGIITNENTLTINNLERDTQTFIDYIDADELTIHTYKAGIGRFIEYLKDNNIEQPARNDIIAFRDMLRETYSSNTTNTYMVAIRSLFKYLGINKMYDNVCVDIKGARYDTTPKKQVLSLNQVKDIYNSLENLEDKCLFSLLVTTGLRGIEVSRARIEDIKDYNGEKVLWVWGKKRDSYDEYVKLSQKVLQDIYNYIGNRNTGYIFISNSNNNKGNGITTKTIRCKIKKIFKDYGIDDDSFSTHSLRRTSATLMYELGEDVQSIQQILHHASSNTTQRYINAVTRNNNKGEYIVSNAIFN